MQKKTSVILCLVLCEAASEKDARMWPDCFMSSWMFERVNFSEPLRNASVPMMSYGEFWYDWPSRRAVLTHDLCPLWLPSETQFSPWPCNTVFNGTDILVVSNASSSSPSCCRWYNPWNATVTSPDWVVRANATEMEDVSHEAGFPSRTFVGDLPFRWRYGTRLDRPNLPFFLDHYDTPDDPNMASRWLLSDAHEIEENQFDLTLLENTASCPNICQMRVPFPVPADDSVKYPHVENLWPDISHTQDGDSRNMNSREDHRAASASACPALAARRAFAR